MKGAAGYNIYYELTAGVFDLLLLLFSFLQYGGKTRHSRVYRILLIALSVSCFADAAIARALVGLPRPMLLPRETSLLLRCIQHSMKCGLCVFPFWYLAEYRKAEYKILHWKRQILILTLALVLSDLLCRIVFPYGEMMDNPIMSVGAYILFFMIESWDYERIRVTTEKVSAAAEEADLAVRETETLQAMLTGEMTQSIGEIRQSADRLKRAAVRESTKKNAGSIVISLQLLQFLEEDLADFAAFHRDDFKLRRERFHLGTILDEVSEVISATAEEKNLSFSLSSGKREEDVWYGDRGRVRQILINLCANGIKYTESGGVTLTVEERESGGLRVLVADTGIGIRKEDQADLFRKYKRFDAEKNRNTVGTGLGLYIVWRLVGKMKGSIRVESEYGHGSCFIVELPLERAGTLMTKHPILDPERGLSFCSGSREHFEQFLRIFMNCADRARDRLTEDFSDRRGAAFRRDLYNIRIVAENIGAREMADRAALMERYEKASRLSRSTETEAALQRELRGFLDIYDETVWTVHRYLTGE